MLPLNLKRRKRIARICIRFEDLDLQPDEVMDLIPVKPIIEHEAQIKAICNDKLIALFEKIKP